MLLFINPLDLLERAIALSLSNKSGNSAGMGFGTSRRKSHHLPE